MDKGEKKTCAFELQDMQEKIYNIFYFVDNDTISEVAICVHERSGTDEEKLAWLRGRVKKDASEASRVTLAKELRFGTFNAMHRLGHQTEIFEELFESVGAPRDILYCVTAVVDGVPRFDIVTGHDPLKAEEMQSLDPPTLHPIRDWLREYNTEKGFDLPRLLNDDYFAAIRLLFNAKRYVSCVKLLVSFIDTVSFLAYGDEREVFIKWLDAYVSLDALGINSEELWEMRNSLLHMSNLDSRKVLQNRVRRIGFCITSPDNYSYQDRDITYFNLLGLINAVAHGLSNWLAILNANDEEFVYFVERYDRIISDERLTHIAKS